MKKTFTPTYLGLFPLGKSPSGKGMGMKMKVLILEDNGDSRMAIRTMIQREDREIQVIEAASYEEGKQILEGIADVALFFLDINLDPYNVEDTKGLAFARWLRSIPEYDFAPIVFITSILSLELTAYREFQCYRYITKPFHEEEIQDIVKKVKEHQFYYGKQHEDTLLLKKDGINFKIRIPDILYAQTVPRGVMLHMKGVKEGGEETISVKYMTLKQIMEKLPEQDFLQCHRMFLINKQQVEYVDFVNRRIKLQGCGDWVEIGVTYKSRIKEMFHG